MEKTERYSFVDMCPYSVGSRRARAILEKSRKQKDSVSWEAREVKLPPVANTKDDLLVGTHKKRH